MPENGRKHRKIGTRIRRMGPGWKLLSPDDRVFSGTIVSKFSVGTSRLVVFSLRRRRKENGT